MNIDVIKQCIISDDVDCVRRHIVEFEKKYWFYDEMFKLALLKRSISVIDYFIYNVFENRERIVTELVDYYIDNKLYDSLVFVLESIEDLRNYIIEDVIRYTIIPSITFIRNKDKEVEGARLMRYMVDNFSNVIYSRNIAITVFNNIGNSRNFDVLKTYLSGGKLDVEKYNLYKIINEFIYSCLHLVTEKMTDEFISDIIAYIFNHTKNIRKKFYLIENEHDTNVVFIFYNTMRLKYYKSFYTYFSMKDDDLYYFSIYIKGITKFYKDGYDQFYNLLLSLNECHNDKVYDDIFNVIIGNEELVKIVMQKFIFNKNINIISNIFLSKMVEYYNLSSLDDLHIIKNLII